MVQIVPPKSNPLSQIFQGANAGLSGFLQEHISNKFAEKQVRLKQQLEQEAKKEEEERNSKFNEQNYENVKKLYGKNYADVWRSLHPGAQTELQRGAHEAALRGADINEFLFPEYKQTQQNEDDSGIQEPFSAEELSNLSKGKSSKKLVSEKEKVLTKPKETISDAQDKELPDIKLDIQGLKPSEANKLRAEMRKENLPSFQATNSKLRGLKNEQDHLKILEKLSPKVPDGLSRLFINKEGHIRPLAQTLKLVPPEAEQFVKTVNDFISGAKEIFGSRVTNFDLQTFQSRLPTLINSSAGRKKIIEQMNIFNEIESNYLNELKKIYSHYGLDGIKQEDAESLASKNTEQKESELRKKLVEDQSDSNKKLSLDEIFK